MGDFEDSMIAIVLYHSILATFVVVSATLICGAAAALIIEFLEDFVRTARRKVRERVRAFLAGSRESRASKEGLA